MVASSVKQTVPETRSNIKFDFSLPSTCDYIEWWLRVYHLRSILEVIQAQSKVRDGLEMQVRHAFYLSPLAAGYLYLLSRWLDSSGHISRRRHLFWKRAMMWNLSRIEVGSSIMATYAGSTWLDARRYQKIRKTMTWLSTLILCRGFLVCTHLLGERLECLILARQQQ